MEKKSMEAAPGISKVLLENDKVRVIEMKVKKGTKVGLHTHPAYFAYAITPIQFASFSVDGKKVNRKLAKSAVDWHDGESHAVEFLTPGRALVVELK